MKRKKVTEPRTKRKISGTPDETSKSYRAANFWGPFWGDREAVAEKNGFQIRIPRPRFSKKDTFQI